MADPIVSSDSLICIVGGASLGNTIISKASSYADTFVGVDGGADHLLRAGIMPEVVLGDFDSLSDRARRVFADRLNELEDQSTTDFEKALESVSATTVLAIGFTGGRIDHTLSVLGAMARRADRAIVLLDQDDVSWLPVIGTTCFDLAEGTRVSCMPLGQAAVTMAGVQWPFEDRLMTPAGFSSPSNAAIGGTVTVQTDGPVLLTLPQAFLPIALQAAARVG